MQRAQQMLVFYVQEYKTEQTVQFCSKCLETDLNKSWKN